METEIKHYFLASHSGRGFVHYFGTEIQSLNYVYVLKGVPGNGQSTLMKNIASYFHEKKEPIDMIHRAFDPDALDGIILKNLGIGLVDGTHPHVVEPEMPFVTGEYVDLSQACRVSALDGVKRQIVHLKKTCDTSFHQYATAIAQSLSLHDELEQYYSGELNIDAANQLAADTIQAIFADSRVNKEAAIKDRFFDVITEEGNVDFVQDITKACTRRYFIKGAPGSGKSSLLKQLVEASRERGYDVERYHCDFDPDSLDLIVIPELRVAAFDSTAPHNYAPSRAGDEIIDTYSLIETNTDQVYQQQIDRLKASNKTEGEKANHALDQAKQAYQDMVNLYAQAVDGDEVKAIETSIIARIEAGETVPADE